MSRDPFDEFRKIEKMFQKVMSGDSLAFGGSSHGISIQKLGDETKVEVHGDVSEEEIERLRKKYPDAEISVNGKRVSGSGPVEVLDEKSAEDRRSDKREESGPVIEEEDEEDLSPSDLALKRFKEKKEEEKS